MLDRNIELMLCVGRIDRSLNICVVDVSQEMRVKDFT